MQTVTVLQKQVFVWPSMLLQHVSLPWYDGTIFLTNETHFQPLS